MRSTFPCSLLSFIRVEAKSRGKEVKSTVSEKALVNKESVQSESGRAEVSISPVSKLSFRNRRNREGGSEPHVRLPSSECMVQRIW